MKLGSVVTGNQSCQRWARAQDQVEGRPPRWASPRWPDGVQVPPAPSQGLPPGMQPPHHPLSLPQSLPPEPSPQLPSLPWASPPEPPHWASSWASLLSLLPSLPVSPEHLPPEHLPLSLPLSLLPSLPASPLSISPGASPWAWQLPLGLLLSISATKATQYPPKAWSNLIITLLPEASTMDLK